MTRLLAAFFLLVAGGCGRFGPAPVSTQPAPPVPAFEIRGLNVEGETTEHFARYTVSASLLAASPELKQGVLFVFVKYKDKNQSGSPPREMSVFMQDGFAEFTTFSYFGGEDLSRARPPDFEFEIGGYTRLDSATVKVLE